MYCTKCGSELNDDAVICPHCGVATANMQKLNQPQQTVQNGNNLFAIFGFTLSVASIVCLMIDGFLFMLTLIIALVLSVIGLVKSKSSNNGKGLSIAGIVISSVLIVGFIVLTVMAVLFTLTFFFIFSIPFL